MQSIVVGCENCLIRLLATVLFLFPISSTACSCWHPSPQALLESSSLIFAGKVSSVDQKSRVAYFAVNKVYKGVVIGGSVAIRFNGGSGAECGISFQEGTTHTLFAKYQQSNLGEDTFSTDLCMMIPYRSSPYRFQPILDAYAIEVSKAKRIADENVSSVEAWDSLSRIHESNKDYLAALISLEKLRSVTAESVDALVRIGNAQLALGRFSHALATFNLTLTHDQNSIAAKQGRNQALLKLGRAGELDLDTGSFSGMDLGTPDFNGKTMTDFDFSKTKMSRPSFASADLKGSNFSGANIYIGNFKDAKMSDVQFVDTSTYECNFENADFSGANFTGADVRAGKFVSSNMRGARFIKTRAESANFSNASFQSAKFKEVYFLLANLSGVDLSGHDLSGSEM